MLSGAAPVGALGKRGTAELAGTCHAFWNCARRGVWQAEDDGGNQMNEKIYKTMAVTGAGNIALGVVVLISGIACGVVAIVSGARLLKRKSDIIF